MALVFLIGRVIFSIVWLRSAYNHLIARRKDMIAYTASQHVPAPALAVVGTGILLLIGGLSMLTGLWPYLGLSAIAIFLIGVTPVMHAYWKTTDPMMRMNAHINFWKNMTLLGAVLMMFMIAVPWLYAL